MVKTRIIISSIIIFLAGGMLASALNYFYPDNYLQREKYIILLIASAVLLFSGIALLISIDERNKD